MAPSNWEGRVQLRLRKQARFSIDTMTKVKDVAWLLRNLIQTSPMQIRLCKFCTFTCTVDDPD